MTTHPQGVPHILDDLRWRGLLHQCTDEAAFRAHLDTAGPGGRRIYAGFDPTSDSLTIGNLVPALLLARFQRAGHTPVVVMGGGTGLIGDPSGKTAERQLRTPDEIAHNVERQRRIFDRLIRFSPDSPNRGLIANNIDWLGKLSYLDALRDIGKHFSVNMMIQKESVKERLHNRDQGISYTEFSYMVLQAYDFAHLYKAEGVTAQVGGSDQWGNIVAGCDLIRRFGGRTSPRREGAPGEADKDAPDSFGLTVPLVTKADGTKFGKTESGAVWLTGDRTSPYAFYQFWLNSADADVGRFLRTFTFFSHTEIESLESAHATDPGKREAHRALARHMTELLHGPEGLEQAENAAKALFTGELSGLSAQMLDEVLAGAPTSSHNKVLLEGPGLALVDLLATTTLASSKTQARQLLNEGSISVNGHKAAPDARVSAASLLHGKVIALRRGKKSWHITTWA